MKLLRNRLTSTPNLDRRTLLRGLGAGAALLPLLSTRARAARRPTRLICVVQTGGYLQADWQPAAGPLVAPLPSSLAPLEQYRGLLLVLPELTPAGPVAGSRYGSLFHGTAATAGAFPGAAGATLDQVVGASLGRARRSLALGVQLDSKPQLDPAPAYRRAFWTGPGAAVEPELDPLATYARLFGGTTPGEVEPLLSEGRSLLDYAGRSLTRFRNRLGSQDWQLIDIHLESVRSLESRLGATARAPAQSCSTGPLSRGGTALDLAAQVNYTQVLDLQFDLLLAALKCGVTNVATLQLCDATAANVDPRFGAALPAQQPFTSWRDLARATDAASVAAKRRLDLWCMTRFARLLGDLQATLAPSGASLLDESIVVWANDQFDGRTPEVAKVPLLVASTGFLPAGRCLPGARPLPGVLATLAETLGATTHPFGKALSLRS